MLDKPATFCYNRQVVKRERRKPLSARRRAILENDTEGKYKEQSDFEELNASTKAALRAAGFGEPVVRGGEKLRIRIEHQSLILAQDERWRRA